MCAFRLRSVTSAVAAVGLGAYGDTGDRGVDALTSWSKRDAISRPAGLAGFSVYRFVARSFQQGFDGVVQESVSYTPPSSVSRFMLLEFGSYWMSSIKSPVCLSMPVHARVILASPC